MFLSIIIPHYNLERQLLERCLSSIAQQQLTPKEFEVIVVDDGSTEPPLWILEIVPLAQSLILLQQTHKGLGAARNYGMNVAKGQYILFVDSDDYLFADSLQPCIALLRAQQPQLLGFHFKKCYELGVEPIAQKPFKQSYTYSGAYYMQHNHLMGCVWHYFFSHELAQRNHIRFNEGILHEDEDFTTRVYYFAQTAIHCNVTVYAYYQRENSIVANQNVNFHKARFADLLKTFHFLRDFQLQQLPVGNIVQQRGLKHKITMLTVDFIISMLRCKMPYGYISQQLEELKQIHIFPLPNEKYGIKYIGFRLLTQTRLGMWILRKIETQRKKRL